MPKQYCNNSHTVTKETIPFIHTYQTLPEVFYHRLSADPVTHPQLLRLNTALADSLGLDLSAIDNQQLAQWFSGQHLPNTASPIAQAYAGHQFGQLTLLGDGRALLLGELTTPQQQLIDVQLKGSGQTPYSRRGDGRAALAPMLREYLISEAMFALGIPTSRSLAVVTTGDSIRRMGVKKGAILTRTAASHIRIGTFVYAAIVANKDRNNTPIQALLDYSIQRHYPELAASDNPALAFLMTVGQRQITLINEWLRVGFIHGVMNTDNVCISGETIDYGPCAFMNVYDEQTVFSSIDYNGRYAYGNQSPIILWNLARLAESLLPLIADNETTAIDIVTEALEQLTLAQQKDWQTMMANKLGLSRITDVSLINLLLAAMQAQTLDYTNTFVTLTTFIQEHTVQLAAKSTVELSSITPLITTWLNSSRYQQSAYAEKHLPHPAVIECCNDWLIALCQSNHNAADWKQTVDAMQQNNPMIIPRNHLVEAALTAAEQDDMQAFDKLLASLSTPYQQPAMSHYQQAPKASEQANYQTFCGT